MAIFPTLHPELKVEAIFWVGWDDGDWMAMVYREPEKPWSMTYRFRYYDGADQDDTFNSGDQKSIVSGSAKPEENSPASLVNALRFLSTMIADHYRADTIQEIPVAGNGDDAMALLQQQPWCHIKIVPTPPTSETPQ